ncbi:MAG: hypothetical protein ACKOHM_07275 [Spartobacteria bacterium]
MYLSEYQLLPYDRTAEILRDLHGCDTFSQGTLANFKADCAARLEPVEAAILTQVTAALRRLFLGDPFLPTPHTS